ncbi:hypothetical protein CAPTEDRAFT_228083 [Capitella teleta]|uniref:Uncharacterized protein n=1 Tax=Capitella teleta TaxID=283909 RepID=R7UZY3_CAPTE|nr:hypothetical protein CAPTEDRAFT_228083 [Capitella teleta]|eukprot:ELU08996.1 hypothetical protein CAPTEDRAFT_228083 [Capitella teleta]
MDAEIARLLNSSEEDRQKGLALLDEYYINDDDDLDSDTDYDLMEDGTVLGPTADEEEVAMPPPSAHSAQPHSQTLDQLLDGLVPEPQCVDNLDHLESGHGSSQDHRSSFYAFRRSKVDSLECMESVVNGSAACNIAQPIGWEDGRVVVPVYDWNAHLSPHGQHMKGIKENHHFKFDSDHPGVVRYSIKPDGPWQQWRLFKNLESLPSAPPVPCQPPGLPKKRREYLYHQIRPFVSPAFQDVTTPHPDIIAENFAAYTESHHPPSPPPPPPPATAAPTKTSKRRKSSDSATARKPRAAKAQKKKK